MDFCEAFKEAVRCFKLKEADLAHAQASEDEISISELIERLARGSVELRRLA